MKKVLVLTSLLLASLIAFTSCASKDVAPAAAEVPAGPSAAKAAALELDGAIDMATWDALDKFAIKYNDEAYTLKLNGCEFVQFPLEKPLEAGDVITVNLKGVNTGKNGFRSWVVDDHQTTNCANPDGLYFTTKDPNFGDGDFDVTFQLEATAPSTFLFIKGIQWGTMIEGVTLTSVAVTYN